VAARLRHVAATGWGTKRYLDMRRLRELEEEQSVMPKEPVA
jgi:putative transposase